MTAMVTMNKLMLSNIHKNDTVSLSMNNLGAAGRGHGQVITDVNHSNINFAEDKALTTHIPPTAQYLISFKPTSKQSIRKKKKGEEFWKRLKSTSVDLGHHPSNFESTNKTYGDSLKHFISVEKNPIEETKIFTNPTYASNIPLNE